VIDELKWSRVLLSDFGGPKATLAGTAQEVEGKIIVFGGYCKSSYTNGMFSFDISKLMKAHYSENIRITYVD
jgi:hypothetical protein